MASSSQQEFLKIDIHIQAFTGNRSDFKMSVQPRITLPTLLSRKNSGKKISCLTVYDYTSALLLEQSGVDLLLVGDSLGSVIQGHETTLAVTLEQMIYHCACVTRATRRCFVVGDMPFLSYQPSITCAIESAGLLLKQGGVAAVKLEGGVAMADRIAAIVSCDIPVMGHIGLTPQSYHRMGGYREQGKEVASPLRKSVHSAEQVLDDALAVEQAGAFAIVLEGIPEDLAARITEKLSIPTIGIGAGPFCDGQILVLQDMLGMNQQHCPSFVKQFANIGQRIVEAAEQYDQEVKNSTFPLSKSFSGSKTILV